MRRRCNSEASLARKPIVMLISADGSLRAGAEGSFLVKGGYQFCTNRCITINMIDPWKCPIANWGHALGPEGAAVPFLEVQQHYLIPY